MQLKTVLLFDLSMGEIKIGSVEVPNDKTDFKLMLYSATKDGVRVSHLSCWLGITEKEVIQRVWSINERCGGEYYKIQNGTVFINEAAIIHVVVPNGLFEKSKKIEGVT